MRCGRKVRDYLASLTFLLLLGLSTPVWAAANLGIAPIIITLPADDMATSVEITNNGNADVTLESSIDRWVMPRAGDAGQPPASRDLFVSPPVFRIAPGVTQVIRVGRLKPVPAPAVERAYRLTLLEVLDQTRPRTAVLATRLQVVLPLFVPPAEPDSKAEPRLDVAVQRSDTGATMLRIRNRSNIRAQIGELTLLRGDATIAQRRLGRYVLADSELELDWSKVLSDLSGPMTLKAQVNNHFEVVRPLQLPGN